MLAYFSKISFLRLSSITMVILAGIVTLGSIIQEGGKDHPIFLLFFFLLWSLSPLMGLLFATLLCKHWSMKTNLIRCGLTLTITAGSLIFYGGIFDDSETNPAEIFMFVPFVSWLVILLLIIAGIYYLLKGSQEKDSFDSLLEQSETSEHKTDS